MELGWSHLRAIPQSPMRHVRTIWRSSSRWMFRLAKEKCSVSPSLSRSFISTLETCQSSLFSSVQQHPLHWTMLNSDIYLFMPFILTLESPNNHQSIFVLILAFLPSVKSLYIILPLASASIFKCLYLTSLCFFCDILYNLTFRVIFYMFPVEECKSVSYWTENLWCKFLKPLTERLGTNFTNTIWKYMPKFNFHFTISILIKQFKSFNFYTILTSFNHFVFAW